MRLRKYPRHKPLVAPSFEDLQKTQFLCVTAASSPMSFVLSEHYRWMREMRSAQDWLEGIRADRAKHLAWEYAEAPAFSFAD